MDKRLNNDIIRIETLKDFKIVTNKLVFPGILKRTVTC